MPPKKRTSSSTGGTSKRVKRRNQPNAALYVGYVDDDEDIGSIMAKFAMLEEAQKKESPEEGGVLTEETLVSTFQPDHASLVRQTEEPQEDPGLNGELVDTDGPANASDGAYVRVTDYLPANLSEEEQKKSMEKLKGAGDAPKGTKVVGEEVDEKSKEVKEVPLLGFDAYTCGEIMANLPKGLSEYDRWHFVTKLLVPALNARSDRQESGEEVDEAGATLRGAAVDVMASEALPKKYRKAAEMLGRAIKSRPLNFLVHPKGVGLLCTNPEGIPSGSLLGLYVGEVYPPWRWCEREDAGVKVKKRVGSKEVLPVFYNMMFERVDDERGYDVLWIDAKLKGGIFTRASHSCEPNAHSGMLRRGDGSIAVGLWASTDIVVGEEVCYDYNCRSDQMEEVQNAICLCSSPACRGSFLSYCNEPRFQEVICRDNTAAHRAAALLHAAHPAAFTGASLQPFIGKCPGPPPGPAEHAGETAAAETVAATAPQGGEVNGSEEAGEAARGGEDGTGAAAGPSQAEEGEGDGTGGAIEPMEGAGAASGEGDAQQHPSAAGAEGALAFLAASGIKSSVLDDLPEWGLWYAAHAMAFAHHELRTLPAALARPPPVAAAEGDPGRAEVPPAAGGSPGKENAGAGAGNQEQAPSASPAQGGAVPSGTPVLKTEATAGEKAKEGGAGVAGPVAAAATDEGKGAQVEVDVVAGSFTAEEAREEAESIWFQRRQALCITLDKVKYLLRQQRPGVSECAPLRLIPAAEAVERLWNSRDSLVRSVLRAAAPYLPPAAASACRRAVGARLDGDLASSPPALKANESGLQAARENLLALAEELRRVPDGPCASHGAAADVLALIASTRVLSSALQYDPYTSPYVEVGHVACGQGVVHQRHYPPDTIPSQLLTWHDEMSPTPGVVATRERRGCLQLPDPAASCYAPAGQPHLKGLARGGYQRGQLVAHLRGGGGTLPWETSLAGVPWKFARPGAPASFLGTPAVDHLLGVSEGMGPVIARLEEGI